MKFGYFDDNAKEYVIKTPRSSKAAAKKLSAKEAEVVEKK